MVEILKAAAKPGGRRCLRVVAIMAGLVPVCLVGQSPQETPESITVPTPAQIAAGAETITAKAIANHVRVLADDSMRGRDTPSPGLEAAARYIAARFDALDLTRISSNGTWFQRYVLPPQLDFARSRVSFTANGRTAATDLTAAAWLTGRTVPLPGAFAPAPAILVAGRQDSAAVTRLGARNKVVLYVAADAAPSAGHKLLDQLRGESRGVMILTGRDSLDFAREVRAALERPDVQVGTTWSAYVRSAGVPGLAAMLAASGVDLARLRTDTTPMARDLPELQVAFEPRFTRAPSDTTTAPNVVAMLEGADPQLKAQYVVFVAHMDHTGIRRGRADSIANGANDNASGTAALLELAEAFSRPETRPARSLVFLATSGEAKDLWGSRAFAGELEYDEEGTVNAAFGGMTVVDGITLQGHVVAALNLDMIGRRANDSVMVDGLEDVVVPTPIPWLAGAHPELRLTVVNGGPVARGGSDHLAFVQWALPSLSFRTGSHERPPAESPADLDTDLAARITRLVYYVGQDIANGKRKPEWTAEGRRRYLELLP